jgi:misacylated tRNA(Ala) deacylase
MINYYEKNAYKKEFETKIINIDRENNLIELENTAFYGKGGGQPGDTGWLFINLKSLEVLETFRKEGRILHEVNSTVNLEIGNLIKGKIDWKKRYTYMKMHTALHLLCTVVPMGVTGGQIGIQKSRLDFNANSKSTKKEEIQEKLNQILKNNIEISYEWISNEELKKNPELIRTMSVKPPNINDKIRLVKIGNIDLQPCGGTHVKNTSEVGSIIVGKIENKGKMNKRINISLSD